MGITELLTEQSDLIVTNLVEGDIDAWRFSVYERKFAASRLPGERAYYFFTLNSVHWYLLLLHVKYLKVIEHALKKQKQP